jgi:hypothetical protein
MFSLGPSILMAPLIVRIEHPVDNFDAWKRAFESDPVGRKRAGVRRYRVLRPRDDPNYVMIDLEFSDAPEAEGFRSAIMKLWSSPEAQRVMRNPQVRIAEVVDSKEY